MSPASGTPALGRLATHSLVYVAGTALQGFGVLMVTPFVTRVLPRAEFGRVSAALVVIQLAGTIAAAGLPQVILLEYHRAGDGGRGARALVGTMLLFAAGVCALGATFVGVAAPVAGFAVGVPLLVVASAGALTAVVAGQALMRAQQRPGLFLAVALASTVCAQVAGMLAAYAEPTAESFLSGYAVTLLVAGVVSALVARPVWPTRARAAVGRGLRLAAPLLPHAVAMLVLLMGDVVVVAATLGSEHAATYQVALLLGNMPFVLSTALVNAWAPAVLARPQEDRWEWARRTGTAIAYLVGVGGAGVALLAPWLAAFAAPASFDRPTVVMLVSLIVAVAPAYLLYNGASLALIEGGNTGRLAVAAIVSAVALVGLAFAGSSVAGVEGVATARLAGYLLLTGLCGWMARARGLHWRPWPVAGLVGVTALAAVAAGGFLPQDAPGAYWRLGVAALLVLGAGGLAWRVRVRSHAATESRIALGHPPAG